MNGMGTASFNVFIRHLHMSVGSNQESKMGCLTKTQLQRVAAFLKAVIQILIFKVVLGVFDVGSDIINGYNFLSGQFLLGLYFASQRREEYDLVARSTAAWGYQTICLPWLPGLFRISFIASEVKWRSLQCKEVLLNIGGYILMLIAWPLFSPLM